MCEHHSHKTDKLLTKLKNTPPHQPKKEKAAALGCQRNHPRGPRPSDPSDPSDQSDPSDKSDKSDPKPYPNKSRATIVEQNGTPNIHHSPVTTNATTTTTQLIHHEKQKSHRVISPTSLGA